MTKKNNNNNNLQCYYISTYNVLYKYNVLCTISTYNKILWATGLGITRTVAYEYIWFISLRTSVLFCQCTTNYLTFSNRNLRKKYSDSNPDHSFLRTNYIGKLRMSITEHLKVQRGKSGDNGSFSGPSLYLLIALVG